MKKIKISVLAAGIVVAAAVIGIAAFGIVRFRDGKGEGSSVSYIKDNGLYRYNVKSGKEIKLSSNAVSESDRWYARYSALNDIQESPDGKYVFFYEDYDSFYGKLCYMNQNKKDASKEKIDNDVSLFELADDNKVIYMQDTGTLYMYDIKSDEKEKIGVDAVSFTVSEDGKNLFYTTEDSDIYYIKIEEDADKEKLASDIEDLLYYTKDLNTIYYTKESDIYCIKNLKDREKVASDAVPIGSYNDNAGIYYTKNVEQVFTSDTVLIDDFAASDADLPQPLAGKYTKKEQTSTGKTIMVTDNEAFNAAKEKYREKQHRDTLRARFKAELEPYLRECTDIYAYDGAEHEVLKKAAVPLPLGWNSQMCYTFCWGETKIPTINLSDIESYEDITEFISQEFENIAEDGTNAYLLVDGKAVPFTYDSSVMYKVDEEAGIIYGARFSIDSESDKKNYSELFSVTYSDAGVGEAVSIDNDLDKDSALSSLKNGVMYYYKDYDSELRTGTLYCNGDEIDQDVYYHYYDEGSKMLYYLKEKSKSGNGMLCSYDGSKTAKLIDDAVLFNIVDGKHAVVLVNYSTKRKTGDLKLVSVKDGGKPKKIDEDVSLIQDSLGNYGVLTN
ncbi:hypothetical protein C0033_12645 [Clostridium sp. chh4-2]|uniref:hypothetical protein n=1 Tax=Clostridium sp. chh4-2 TaxID=2067550 RepID=UPI000CCEE901|nr:hypothetical protein [Clostridium sp. chh4-2]PNV59610.1 hypothetical protein C0033_22995 [Clostridium sp. chh4-2]PNV61730.1 hypothetical protein C0033_12645 [Clostridium sp. chh4-2]